MWEDDENDEVENMEDDKSDQVENVEDNENEEIPHTDQVSQAGGTTTAYKLGKFCSSKAPLHSQKRTPVS